MLTDKFPGSLFSTSINFSQEQYNTLTMYKKTAVQSPSQEFAQQCGLNSRLTKQPESSPFYTYCPKAASDSSIKALV